MGVQVVLDLILLLANQFYLHNVNMGAQAKATLFSLFLEETA